MNLQSVSAQKAGREKRLDSPPCVTLVLPFNPKMTPRHDLETQIQNMQASAEKDLLTAHPSGDAMPVIRRMQQLLRNLNFSTHKTGVALFASAGIGKTIYLDFTVERKAIIDGTFRVRDLADCKPGRKEYLLLMLSGAQSKTYIYDDAGLRLIKNNAPNFSDTGDRHEVMLNKFLHHMDEGLGAVLKAYPLPVFVAGSERVTGHFGRITRHGHTIAGYIHNDCIYANERKLEEMLAPVLENWRQVTGRLLLSQMERAADAGKLVCGIDEVRRAARCNHSRVIIVEENSRHERAPGEAFYREDHIDEIVETVLDNGGTLEKLDGASLSRYGSIALIRYY